MIKYNPVFDSSKRANKPETVYSCGFRLVQFLKKCCTEILLGNFFELFIEISDLVELLVQACQGIDGA